VVITGVTRGLGRALAEGFRTVGATVAGCGRSAAAIADLSRAFGPPHQLQILDVTDDNAVSAWAREVVRHLGPPDYLLNNAALINRSAPLWELSAAEFSAVIDTNLKGMANVIRHFVPSMLERGRGTIVNFSSGWGRSTDANVAPYCCTKWGVEGLTQALAQELPEGMAAVALNPGIIDTAMLRSCFGASASQYPTPGDWARRAVPYLLSLNARHNGQSLTAPG
jgi:NAD(P)-dependent dehydrogenase (short-subunit alcohol dehydrogenase family)